MNREPNDSLDPCRRIEEAWERYDKGGEKPQWRSFLPVGGVVHSKDLLNICMSDIECRLARGESPPLIQDYVATDEKAGLDEEHQFELIEFEYQWCWRHYAGREAQPNRPIRPPSKADYERRYPGLRPRIAGLKTRWLCDRCGRMTDGDEADNPPSCKHCGAGVDITAVNHPRAPTGHSTIAGLLDPDPLKPPPFDRIGPYRLGQLLGTGGMGAVYAAQHVVERGVVAIKVLAQGTEGDSIKRSRFLNEKKFAGLVRRHNHVAPVHLLDEHKDENGDRHLYLVMPLLRGKSLRQRLDGSEGKKLASENVILLGRHLALGLDVIHKVGIVHRDIKPANLFLEDLQEGGWQAVILDFGLARTIDSREGLTQDLCFVGTPGYISPEQSRGHCQPSCDLFGLGCVLYESAAGVQPFSSAIVTDAPRPPHEIEPSLRRDLSDLIMNLLQKDPESRLTAEEVAKELGRMGATDGATTGGEKFNPVDATESPVFAPPATDSSGVERNQTGRRPFWSRRKALGTVGAAGVGGAWFGWNRLWRKTTPPVLAGDLEVKIEVSDGSGRGWISLDDRDALPLRPDDGYIVVATVNRPAFVYIVLIKPDGVVKPVYPWTEPGNWDTRPTREETLTPDRPFVFEPPLGQGHSWRIPTGPPGMLTLMMLARDTPLPAGTDLTGLIGPVRPQKEQSFKAKAWFENGSIVRGRPDRDADFEAKPGDDPVLEVQARVRAKLVGLVNPFVYSLAVTFATQGRKPR